MHAVDRLGIMIGVVRCDRFIGGDRNVSSIRCDDTPKRRGGVTIRYDYRRYEIVEHLQMGTHS